MTPELDAKLCADFPELYRNRHGDMRTTAMCWGFECGDGWEPLIRRLSEQLQFLSKVSGVKFTATQVKEKFGTLRFYYSESAAIDDLTPDASIALDLAQAAESEAERISAHTCEMCGSHARIRRGGWIQTLCARHAYERKYPIDSWEAESLGVTDHIRQKEDT